MKQFAVLIVFALALAGCDSSKPAPKPASAVPQASPEQMEKNIREAEAKQPCSDQNLKNATEDQKRNCNPSQGMFDNVKPAQSPPKAAPKQSSKSTRKS